MNFFCTSTFNCKFGPENFGKDCKWKFSDANLCTNSTAAIDCLKEEEKFKEWLIKKHPEDKKFIDKYYEMTKM